MVELEKGRYIVNGACGDKINPYIEILMGFISLYGWCDRGLRIDWLVSRCSLNVRLNSSVMFIKYTE